MRFSSQRKSSYGEEDELDEEEFVSMLDYDDAEEDETAEGLGVGEITTEDVDNEY